MTSHSQVIEFSAVGGVESCIMLPVPPRGSLERLIIKQKSGTAVASSFSVLNRRGASPIMNDMEVRVSGTVSTVVTEGGMAAVTMAAAHGLLVGETFEIKGCNVGGYNTTFTVTDILSDVKVVTNVAYISNGAGGLWQISPFIPTYDPAMHVVYSNTTVSGVVFQQFSLKLPYANEDNQNVHIRTRRSALWLSITPGGTGAKTWQLALTAIADSLV